MKLVRFKVVTIDKVRGTDTVLVNALCTFDHQGKEYEVSGITTGESLENVASLCQQAKESAENLFKLMFNIESSSESKVSEPLSKFVREVISPAVMKEAKTYKQDELKKLYEPADDHKQKKVSELCETLGIDIIPVQDSWTMIEVLVLISYLEKMADGIVGGQ